MIVWRMVPRSHAGLKVIWWYGERVLNFAGLRAFGGGVHM